MPHYGSSCNVSGHFHSWSHNPEAIIQECKKVRLLKIKWLMCLMSFWQATHISSYFVWPRKMWPKGYNPILAKFHSDINSNALESKSLLGIIFSCKLEHITGGPISKLGFMKSSSKLKQVYFVLRILRRNWMKGMKWSLNRWKIASDLFFCTVRIHNVLKWIKIWRLTFLQVVVGYHSLECYMLASNLFCVY